MLNPRNININLIIKGPVIVTSSLGGSTGQLIPNKFNPQGILLDFIIGIKKRVHFYVLVDSPNNL